jgi:predicted nucleotidyltransferase
MKILGIITEYNPFHNGHLYHLSKARETTNQDANGFACIDSFFIIISNFIILLISLSHHQNL